MPTFDSATFAAGPTANFDWNVRRLSNRSSPLMKEAFLDDEAIRGMMSHSSQFNRTGRSQSHPTAAPMPHTRATTNTGSTCHPPPLHSQLQYNHQHLQNAQHHQHSQLLLPNLYSPHSPKSMLEYTAEEQQRAQSIVTNVYVNCGPTNGSHRSRRSMAAAAAIRKRRSSHMTASVSCHNLSHQHLVDVNQKQINGDDSDAVAIERMRAHSQNDRQSGKSNAQNRNARLTSSILHNELKDELNTNQTNQTERKCHDSMSSAESSNRSIARESVEQTMESELNVSAADHVDTATNNPTWMMAEASAVITNSRCSHRLHHKPPIDLTRSYVKPLKFEHVKPKVDTGPPTTYASKSPAPAKLNEPTSTRLPRSKSNLEFVDLDELDEKGDLVQTAQKSVRK